MTTPETKIDPSVALNQMLATLEFVKIVTHLKSCSKTGPALARMVVDPKHGEANVELICTALVALQGLLGKMITTGNEAEAREVQPLLLDFMSRLGDEHEAPSAEEADTSVVH